MEEARQGSHHGRLPGMVQFEPRNPLAIKKHGRLTEAAQFTTVEKRFEDVLLYLLITRGYALQFLAQGSQVLHSLVDAVILFDIVVGGFAKKHIVIPHIIFG